MRHDPSGYEQADGKLTLPAAHGDFFAAGANNNPNMILQPAPSGPWTMETRMTFVPNENYEQAGLLVYGDDANYVKADLVHSGGRAVEFLREVNDAAAGFGGTVNLPGDFPPTIDLRIVSDGTTLRAFYRPAGDGPWAPFGEPAPLAAVPNPKVGFYANDSNATVATRDDAVFDYFRLTPGAPDDTAPADDARARAGVAGRRAAVVPLAGPGDAVHGGGRHDGVPDRQRGLPALHRAVHDRRRRHARGRVPLA